MKAEEIHVRFKTNLIQGSIEKYEADIPMCFVPYQNRNDRKH